MSQPRYLFVPAEVLAAPSPERRVRWRAAQGNTDPANQVAWRLLGGNNHELGRSIMAYENLDACVAATEALKAGLPDSETSVSQSAVSSHWGWRLTVDGLEVAASGRWYRREREARYNLEQFLSVAPTAAVVGLVGSRSRLRPTVLSSRARAEVARLGQPIDDLRGSRATVTGL